MHVCLCDLSLYNGPWTWWLISAEVSRGASEIGRCWRVVKRCCQGDWKAEVCNQAIGSWEGCTGRLCYEYSLHGGCQPEYLIKHLESSKVGIGRRPCHSQSKFGGAFCFFFYFDFFFFLFNFLICSRLSRYCCRMTTASFVLGWEQRGYWMALIGFWPWVGAWQSRQRCPARGLLFVLPSNLDWFKLRWVFACGSCVALFRFVFVLQGSAVAYFLPSLAHWRSFTATAPPWGRSLPSSAQLSTSWRGRASSPACGKGTGPSGPQACPPASVRIFLNNFQSLRALVYLFCPMYLLQRED